MDSIPIASIKIGKRFRQDLGDIAALAKSIQSIGLLHPLVVTPDNQLIAGRRRLEALKELRWQEAPVNVVDLKEIVRGEHDENAFRKDFTVTERIAIGKALEPLERKKAAERKKATHLVGKGKQAGPNGEEKFSQPLDNGRTTEKKAERNIYLKNGSAFVCIECGEEFDHSIWHCFACGYHSHTEDRECGECHKPRKSREEKSSQRKDNGKATEKVASKVGMSRPTYEKASAVIDAAKSNPELFGDLVDEMDRSGHVEAAFKKMRQRKVKKEIEDAVYETATIENLSTAIKDGKTYGTIYVDPPWNYSNKKTRAAADNHYTTMTVEEIAALPVKQLAAEKCHLHLWTTNAFLFECPKLFEAWGFEFKSVLVWVKPQLGLGNYWRVSHEFLLLGVKGGLAFPATNFLSWIQADRTEHSRKPHEIRKRIETVSPGPRLEMFGRQIADGWDHWGNQIDRGMFDTDVEAR